MLNFNNFFSQGLKSTLRIKPGTNWSYKGQWVQVFDQTQVDRWYIGDFSSASYRIVVENDSHTKEIINLLVVATQNNASLIQYGRVKTTSKIVDFTVTVNDSYVNLIASPAQSSFSGSKLIFTAEYSEVVEQPTPSQIPLKVQNNPFDSEYGFETAGFVVSDGLLTVTNAEITNLSIGESNDTIIVNDGVVIIKSKDGPSGSINNLSIGSITPANGTFTNLVANTSVNFNTTGTIIINPGSVGNINNVNIGLTTPQDGRFINLTTNSVTVGTGYTPTNATYTPSTGVMTLTIGAHNLQPGDVVYFSPYSITFTCGLDNNQTLHSYPRALNVPNSSERDPTYNNPVVIISVTLTTITLNVGVSSDTSTHVFVNAAQDAIIVGPLTAKNLITKNLDIPKTGTISVGASYTPTNASYTPATGQLILTLENHELQEGDAIFISPYSLTFTCALDGNSTLHAYPRSTGVPNIIGADPVYNRPVIITAITATTIEVNVGVSSDTSLHTFVSAKPSAITVGNLVTKNLTTKNLAATNTTVDDVVIKNKPSFPSHGARKDYVDATATALAIALGG